MAALITAAEVISIASKRNINAGHILASDIATAELTYVRDAIGQSLYDAVVEDTTTYATFITTYVKPVLAYGILANNWNRIKVVVTDRGVNRLTGENTQTATEDDSDAARYEVRSTLNTLIQSMIDFISDDPLYEDQAYECRDISYSSIQAKRQNAL